jgi:hypothetical protein
VFDCQNICLILSLEAHRDVLHYENVVLTNETSEQNPNGYFNVDIVFTFGSTASVVWWLACWPLVPEFAGSIPTEAVGFFPM